MAELLSHVTSVSSRLRSVDKISDDRYDCQLRDLVTYIKQSDKNFDSEYLLNNLNPSHHTLSYLLMLNFKIKYLQNKRRTVLPEELKPGNDLWVKAVLFFRTFDPIQVRYAGGEWRQLIEIIGQAAEATAKPFLAVQVIRDAMLRLDPSSGILTSVHIIFLRLSLLSRSYSYALPVIGKPVIWFPTGSVQAYKKYIEQPLCSELVSMDSLLSDSFGFSAKLTYRDHTQYFLYGAMVYMALKEWDKSLHWLSIVISSPVNDSVSKIMVEAYKKWVLVSLLGHGKLVTAPKIISSHVLKVFQSLAKPYLSLSEAFERNDLQRLRLEADVGQSIWRHDNNEGLVSQLFHAHKSFLFLKLGRTFSALTAADVAQQAFTPLDSSSKIEEFVAALVMSGSLRATLVHLHGRGNGTMLHFSRLPEPYITRERCMRTQLAKEGRALEIITNGADQCSNELMMGNENLQLVSKNQKWPDTLGKDGCNIIGEADGGGYEIDEDIMGDNSK
ncbi:COP9 signalosome complex subunit 3 [Aspergillus heteromorphus CBS 117.55]|uniref:COP9 signalosome complex subunit 3 n=1 Tax=Aspergillus heteromorphus CBS 117.55 TaxID=1448321 RepID=A0A317V343_9EURO|nr:COP9 signalosome complex subunit 3 [Aspergillus heteromorphus CBS 117.55]PWY68059.1 COP9 signalosome complex subunit 3 [Aspergillus heteromorphus CBS 117.55]